MQQIKLRLNKILANIFLKMMWYCFYYIFIIFFIFFKKKKMDIK